MTPAPASPTPWLLRWQGLLAGGTGPLASRLSLVAGLVLCALMAGLPLVTRGGLGYSLERPASPLAGRDAAGRCLRCHSGRRGIPA